MLIPAVWAGAVALAIWWGKPWTWIALVVWACIGTLALSRPVGRIDRFFVASGRALSFPPGTGTPGR